VSWSHLSRTDPTSTSYLHTAKAEEHVVAGELIDPPHTPPRRARQSRGPYAWLKHLLTREFTITEASSMMMVAFFLSAVLGAIRQVLFNAVFGTGREANAYYAAARLPDTLFSLIAGGALSSAMIPILISTWRTEGEEAARRLVNLVLSTLLAVLGILVLIGLIFTPAFVTHVLAPGFDRETNQLTVFLTRIMLMEPLILAFGAVTMAVLNSRNQFLLPAISVVSHNFTIISGILVARAYPEVGIYGPTVGVLTGALLQVSILVIGLRSQHIRYRPAWDPRDRHLWEVIRLLIPNGLSVGVGYAGTILDTSFATRVQDMAALPALHNAWLLAGLPITLLGHAIALSAFPRLAAHVVAARWSAMRRTLLQAMSVGVGLSIPTLIGLILFGRPVIRLLFEHGRFDAAAGTLTYAILAVYVLGLPAYIATEVLTRGLISFRDTRTPLLTNTAQFAGRVVMIIWLLPAYGIITIPIAFAVTSAVETLVLGLVLSLKIRRHSRHTRPPDSPAPGP
jgi:putative peptidoglycan lipid II flippase